LTQATWRQVQVEGLKSAYLEDPDIRHFCGTLDGLAFLPVNLVPEGIAYVSEVAPDALGCIVDYLDAIYVSGAFPTVLGNGRLRFRYTPPAVCLPCGMCTRSPSTTQRGRTTPVRVGKKVSLVWSATATRPSGSPFRASRRTTLRRVVNGQPSKRRRRKKTVRQQATSKKMCLQMGSLRCRTSCSPLDIVSAWTEFK